MNATHPLGILIQGAQDKNGWSTRDLQRRAEQFGLDMKHSNFSRLKNHELVSIKGSTIRALSDVLQVPVRRVAEAALASMGVDVQSEQPALEDVVRDSQEFSARDRSIIQGLVATIRSLESPDDKDATHASSTEDHDPPADHGGPADQPSHPRPGQKTGRRLHAVEHPGDRIPLPDNWQDLAADSSRNYGAEEHAAASERGEENQDTKQDD